MTTDGERTNWVYAGIGVALVATVGCGFLCVNHRADAWERAMSRLVVEAQQAGHEAPPAADESEKSQNLEWAAAIVQAIEDGMPSGLMSAPEDEELAQRWNGPYVQNALDLLDSWGQELFYEYLGRHNQEGYDLASAGPDGEFGTADDIANWGEDPEP